jgi:glutathione synthase/RimK-type ligase-like ATP-grasp enzyme
MKKVVVLVANPIDESRDTQLKTVFEELFSFGLKRGVLFFLAPISLFDVRRRVFSKALSYENGKWVWRKSVVPDEVFDRSRFGISKERQGKRKLIARSFPFINSLELNELLTNKWKSYCSFKKYFPKTILIRDRDESKKISQLGTERIVLKPIKGARGRGVLVIERNKLSFSTVPFLCQEFIDSKGGMMGIVGGRHDLRILVANGKPFYAILRVPAKGKLIANLSQGGKERKISFAKIPREVKSISTEIARELLRYGKSFYSIDFIFKDKKIPLVVELNSRPTLIFKRVSEHNRRIIFEQLTNLFTKK